MHVLKYFKMILKELITVKVQTELGGVGKCTFINECHTASDVQSVKSAYGVFFFIQTSIKIAFFNFSFEILMWYFLDSLSTTSQSSPYIAASASISSS